MAVAAFDEERDGIEPFQVYESCGEPRKAQEPYELEAPSIEKMVMRFSNLMEMVYFMMYALLATYLPSWKNRHAMYYASHVQSVVGQPNC